MRGRTVAIGVEWAFRPLGLAVILGITPAVRPRRPGSPSSPKSASGSAGRLSRRRPSRAAGRHRLCRRAGRGHRPHRAGPIPDAKRADLARQRPRGRRAGQDGARGLRRLRRRPLAADGDCNQRQITLADPSAFQVGDGVSIQDKNTASGFAVTTATLTARIDANTFRISMPLYLDYMVSNARLGQARLPGRGRLEGEERADRRPDDRRQPRQVANLWTAAAAAASTSSSARRSPSATALSASTTATASASRSRST